MRDAFFFFFGRGEGLDLDKGGVWLYCGGFLGRRDGGM